MKVFIKHKRKLNREHYLFYTQSIIYIFIYKASSFVFKSLKSKINNQKENNNFIGI